MDECLAVMDMFYDQVRQPQHATRCRRMHAAPRALAHTLAPWQPPCSGAQLVGVAACTQRRGAHGAQRSDDACTSTRASPALSLRRSHLASRLAWPCSLRDPRLAVPLPVQAGDEEVEFAILALQMERGACRPPARCTHARIHTAAIAADAAAVPPHGTMWAARTAARHVRAQAPCRVALARRARQPLAHACGCPYGCLRLLMPA